MGSRPTQNKYLRQFLPGIKAKNFKGISTTSKVDYDGTVRSRSVGRSSWRVSISALTMPLSTAASQLKMRDIDADTLRAEMLT